MKVLYVTAECWPFAKTGGLGDVAYALPQALKKEGINEEDFNIAKKALIGQVIFESEDIMGVHRNIINSIIQKTEVYSEES